MARNFGSLLTVILLAMAAATAFAAPNHEISGEITVLGWENFMRDHLETWQEAIRLFEEDYPNIRVNAIRVPFNEYSDQFVTMLAANLTPDVVWVDGQFVLDWQVHNDLLTNLDPYIERSHLNLSEYAHNAMVQAVPGGGTYALTLEFFLHGYEYHRVHFEEAGLAEPQSGWTWDDFLDTARKLTRRNSADGLTHYALDLARDGDRGPEQWLWQSGGGIWSPDGQDVIIDSPETIHGYQFFIDLIHVHGVAPTLEEAKLRSDNQTMTYSQGLGLTMGHYRYRANTDLVNFGRVPPPIGPAGEAVTYYMRGWAIPKNSQQKDAAWAWIEWWLSPKGQFIFAEQTGRMPTHLPTISSDIRPDLTGSERQRWLNAFMELLPASRPTEISIYSRALDPFHSALDAVWRGEASVQQAVNSSIAAVRSILADLREDFERRQ